ncbi:imidazole glycerol phosphate synthase [Aquimarina atlantica]|uniref:imidazole glycerol-phosphate synthase n=1 Tax=Aquimarina atlantica TaxID=1317122 RepID=A0A023BQT2_9FLAO|nr:AglZ/HisF2 family acetamidino modification protein [Aquimarina atlantica]EZH72294.1 imidazole glycerol phosphate synthase [Aquimarina atlantica]
MLQIRVIPSLLLKNNGLVKSIKFKNHKYIGDPINAIKIFNDKEVDELVFLDISATKLGKGPNFKLLSEIAGECFMPLGYGGGISSLSNIEQILKLGFEKVIINYAAANNPLLIDEAVKEFGTSTIVVSIDVKKNMFGKKKVYIQNGSKSVSQTPIDYAKEMESRGAGEILLNSIDRDGTMIGYDLELIKNISSSLQIPLVACGGAGKLDDFQSAINTGGASAVSAGSLFVFNGPNRAVLINYPSINELENLFK